MNTPGHSEGLKNRLRKGLSAFLMAASFCWLAMLLYKERDAILENFSFFKTGHLFYLAASVILGALANGLLFFVFQRILSRHLSKAFDPVQLAFVFYSGQIVRYLPGRFLSVAYQINKTSQQIPPLTIVRANIEFIVTHVLFISLTCGCILLGHLYSWAYAIPLFLIGLFLFIIYLRFDWADMILFRLRRILPPKVSEIFKKPEHAAKCSYGFAAYVLSCLLAYLLLYIASWIPLKNIFVQFSTYEIVILFASYAIGLLIGFLSIITPGGIGVREASFVMVCFRTLPQHSVAFLSIFFRVWLIAVDLLLFGVSLGWLKVRRLKKSEGPAV